MHARRAGHLVARPLNCGVRRMLIVAAIFVAVLLPFFLLRSGAKSKEVAFSALGFFAAAFPIAVLFAFGSPGLGGGPEADLVTLAGLTVLFYVFSITFTLLFGVPIFLVLRRFNLVRWWSCAVAGVVIGALVAEMILPDAAGADDRIRFLSLCAAVGALSGFAFWAIWRRGITAAVHENAGANSDGVPSA